MELTLFGQVFHFIYTYAIIVDICPFTLDELVQAFHDKVISHLTHAYTLEVFPIFIV